MNENKKEAKRAKVILRKFLITTSLIVLLILSQSESAEAFSGQDVRNFFGSVMDVVFQGKTPTGNAIAAVSPSQIHTKAVQGITIDNDTFNSLQKRLGNLELQFGSLNTQPTTQNVLVIDTAGGNLLRNSSFEAGGTGSIPSQWNKQLDSNSGNTFTSAEGIHSGSLGLKFLGGGTGNFGISQPNTKTIPQRTYTLSAWVKVINAPTATFRIGFWDEQNNKEGSFKNVGISGTKDWFRVSTTVTTPGLITDSKNYFPMFEVQGLTSGAVYMDDVLLTEGRVLTSYNSAQANAGTSSTALGDGAILGSTGGDLYPAQSGTGQLGTSNNKWSVLNLNKASIDANGNLNLSGGLSVGALGSGILHSNSSGNITSSATNLASSDVTGTLPVGNGGTGQTSFTANGVLYGNGSNGLSALTPGTSGYVLQSNGTGSAPSWVAAGSVGAAFSSITGGTNTTAAMVVGTGASLGISGSGTINANQLNGQTTSLGGALTTGGAFTTSGANALTLTTTGTTNVTLPTSGTLSTFGGSFTNLTGGTNTTAAMVVGSGATLGGTGTGTITATAADSNAAAGTVSIGTTNAGALSLGNAGQNTTLTLNGTGLTTLGGNLTFSGAAARTITGPNTGATGALTVTTTGNASGLALNTANATSGNSGAVALTSGTVTTSGTSGNVTINTGNSATATLNTGGITVQSGNITTSGTSGNVALEVGTGGTLGTIQLGVASNAPITTGTGLLTQGGNVTFSGATARTITGPNTGAAGGLVLTTPNATSANSSGLTINTGTTTTSGTVGNILIQTGNSAGAAGSVTIDTGTGTTPTVNVGNTNATTLVLGNASSATSITGNKWGVTSAGAATLSPTAASTTALTVNGTTNATPSDAVDINLLHTGGTATNGLQVNVNATGATTNAVNITQTAGTVTNALRFIGTFASNLISAPNLTITNSGAISSAAQTITSSGANALAVGQAGTTNPAFNVDASTATSATGLNVKSAAAAGGLAVSVLSSGTNENLTINAKGTGTVSINNTATGGITLGQATTITTGGLTVSAGGATVTGAIAGTSSGANALAIGQAGTTNPAFNVDASTASSATGLNVKSAAAAAGVAVSVLSSGTNENLTVDAKGSGTITLNGTGTGNITLGRATTITTGGLTVSAGGATVTGNSTVTGTLGVSATNANAFLIQQGSTNLFNFDTSTATSVNGLSFQAKATGTSPVILAAGTDANLGITLSSKGTGKITATNFAPNFNTVAFSATPTFDASTGNTFKMTLTGNVTSSTITNPTAGQTITIMYLQDATGSRTVVWPANVKLSGGTVTLTTTASKQDTFTFTYDGTNWFEDSRALNE